MSLAASNSAPHAPCPNSKGTAATVFLMAHKLEMGGTQRHMLQVATALADGHFNVRLGCNSVREYFADTLDAELEIAEFRIGNGLFSRKALASAGALVRYLRQHRVSIAHSFSLYSNLMMIPAARMAGVPVVIGSHRQLGDLVGRFQFRFQIALFGLCDRIVCNSSAAATVLILEGLPPKKIVVLPNAVDPEIFAIGARRTRTSRSGKIRVGMIARMSPPKDYPLLLTAAAQLCKANREIEFLFAGDGPDRLQLQSMAKQLGLTNHIRFLGQCSDVASLLSMLDICVLVSNSESAPNSVTESMAAGVPVIATRVGGIPEIISDGETGLLVDPGDATQLADAIDFLADNPEARARLGQNSFVYAVEHFSTAHMRELYEQLYEKCMDEQL